MTANYKVDLSSSCDLPIISDRVGIYSYKLDHRFSLRRLKISDPQTVYVYKSLDPILGVA